MPSLADLHRMMKPASAAIVVCQHGSVGDRSPEPGLSTDRVCPFFVKSDGGRGRDHRHNSFSRLCL